ncbi:MAG: histidine kinase [Proteobacteria bacterium]|nr:histidine kinase [Pseudomonadota bacterium]
MTKLLVGPDNPDGWKLEDIIDEIQNDIVRRSARIVDDDRPEARTVLHNNIEIMQLLTVCSEKAHDSTRVLNTLGPSISPQGGVPRIGRQT